MPIETPTSRPVFVVTMFARIAFATTLTTIFANTLSTPRAQTQSPALDDLDLPIARHTLPLPTTPHAVVIATAPAPALDDMKSLDELRHWTRRRRTLADHVFFDGTVTTLPRLREHFRNITRNTQFAERPDIVLACERRQSCDYLDALLLIAAEPDIAIQRIWLMTADGRGLPFASKRPACDVVRPQDWPDATATRLCRDTDNVTELALRRQPRPTEQRLRERAVEYWSATDRLPGSDATRLYRHATKRGDAGRAANRSAPTVAVHTGLGIEIETLVSLVDGCRQRKFKTTAVPPRLDDDFDDWWNEVHARLAGRVPLARRRHRRPRRGRRAPSYEFGVWAKQHQRPDGGWDAPVDAQGHDHDVAATSLALLAYLAAGDTHRVGQYKKSIRRGLKWLQRDGVPNGTMTPFQPRDHLLAALATGEAYGLTKSPLFRNHARAAALEAIRYAETETGKKTYKREQDLAAWLTLLMHSGRTSQLLTDAEWMRGLAARPKLATTSSSTPISAPRLLIDVFDGRIPTFTEADITRRCPKWDTPATDVPTWFFDSVAFTRAQVPIHSKWSGPIDEIGRHTLAGRLPPHHTKASLAAAYGGDVGARALITMVIIARYRYAKLSFHRPR